MLDNVTMFGLDKLAGGLPAFVNCTQEVLAENLGDILPPEMTVLEILETVEPTSAVIEASRKLKAMGYRLALDDFVWAPKFEPLVKLADYIKVDILLTGAQERTDLFERLRGSSTVMLTEKVETQEQYRQAKDEGFTLFQGYYFCRPLLISNRKIPANRVHHFEMLKMLQSDNFDFHKATELMKRNASLTYRLLRMVNSPMFAHTDIHSIQEALLMVGEEAFRHMVMVAIASDLNGEQPLEILRIAFLRARFCQLTSAHCGLTSGEQFLLGLLSLLPTMMLLPMEELVPTLPRGLRFRQRSWVRLTANASCRRGWRAANAATGLPATLWQKQTAFRKRRCLTTISRR